MKEMKDETFKQPAPKRSSPYHGGGRPENL
jgi:hypothetical protein